METQRPWQQGAQETQGPDTSAQHWWREQQGHRGHTALPGGFRKLLVHSFREPAVLLTCNNLPALRLLTTSPPRAQSHCGKSNPASPQSHQSYARLPSRRWTDSSCAHRVCVNKTTKTWPSGISKKNNIFKTPTESRTRHHCQPGILYPIKFFQKWIQIKDFSKRKKRQWLSTVYLYHKKR